jgi:hypothetical protein
LKVSSLLGTAICGSFIFSAYIFCHAVISDWLKHAETEVWLYFVPTVFVFASVSTVFFLTAFALSTLIKLIVGSKRNKIR